MGYNQNIRIALISDSSHLEIKNFKTGWGKFHRDGDMGTELKLTDVESIKFSPGNNAVICACGRHLSASGTDGSFEVWLDKTQIGKYEWDCPYSGENKSFWTAIDKGDAKNPPSVYVRVPASPPTSGAIGDIQIEFY